MPTHRRFPEFKQDIIRFKNLIRDAEERLVASGVNSTEASGSFEPARRLLDDWTFWEYQSDGLAVFLTRDLFRYYRAPFSFPELVVVTHRFHLKPLLQFLAADGRFFVLALSKGEVKVFDGTLYGVSELEVENLPASFEEILEGYELEKQLQFHSPSPGGQGKQDTLYHGHGGAPEEKDKLTEYFRKVDRALSETLKGEAAPLVVAAVDYLLPIYLEVNSYPHLVVEGVPGNPELLKPEELHQRAWAIVEPMFRKAEQEGAERFKSLLGGERASTKLDEVVPAALHGRVELLFVAVGVQRWGSYDPEKNEIVVRETPQPGDEDLLDLAALHTLLNGGAVYAVEPERVPNAGPVAAVFRY
jgi:hypothetical protein